ncbi:NAD(P)-binding protein [Mytilinidion resinicola]|uniref:NAD(P)-binding protein n=1 Tax=Mytilinidion resinicola TaxID=574789 RepID=A0A6A6YTF4_9PEZI|nr:NAD(P)-binding protein [Mytilinidion resinicola]KAF2811653.1 NAD(P)-binding protein [Mytilinidion resinicola]
MSSILTANSPLLSLTTSTALNPYITGPLLLLLTKIPQSLRDELLRRLSSSSALHIQKALPTTIKTLKWLVSLGLVTRVNRVLNQAALNGWRFRTSKEHKRWNWEKEVAVVTGGSSGIGEAVVKLLVARHVRVAIVDVLPLGEEAEKDPRITHFPCNLTSPTAIASTATLIREALGNPSILINNAGIAKSHSILDTSDEFLHKMFAVNLFSHWSTVQAFLPDMIKNNKGHIVSIASLASYVTLAGMADYAAAKAGALSFHEELRALYHAPNVLTTSVHPTFAATALTASWQSTLEGNGATILKKEKIAEAVVEQVLSCKGGQLLIPGRVGWMTMLKGLPNWVQEVLRDRGSEGVMDAKGKLMGT